VLLLLKILLVHPIFVLLEKQICETLAIRLDGVYLLARPAFQVAAVASPLAVNSCVMLRANSKSDPP
jgi:hypothetical protein